MSRTDIHRPAVFDPTQYEIIDWLDLERPQFVPGMPVETYAKLTQLWREAILRHFPDWHTDAVDHRSVFQCNHCGQSNIRWAAVAEHTPTGHKIVVGQICAEERLTLASRAEFSAKYIKDKAAREKAAAEKAAARAQFEAEAGDVITFLTGLNSDYDSKEPEFLLSLKEQLSAKGTLSEAQVAAARKFLARREEQAERRAAEAAAIETPLREGRYQIEGEIVSTKIQDGNYGATLKMLVKLDDGNKVWGTVPESLKELSRGTWDYEYGFYSDPIELKGQRVIFTATVERSRDDEHFGFFKRPTGAELKEAA